jgi:ArsR family transcriptional regulator
MSKNLSCCTPANLGEVENAIQDSDAEFARLAAALGHPARVAIVRFLSEKGVCICGEIVEVLPLAQSSVSQHLKTLKEAGLIQGETDGPRSCYCVNPAALDRLRVLLGTLKP